MEFGKNAPVTAEDIALADTPHVTLQPTHGDVKPDITDSRIAGRPDNRNFAFETESTAEAALATPSDAAHPHHRLALVLTIGIVGLFVTALAAVYVLR